MAPLSLVTAQALPARSGVLGLRARPGRASRVSCQTSAWPATDDAAGLLLDEHGVDAPDDEQPGRHVDRPPPVAAGPSHSRASGRREVDPARPRRGAPRATAAHRGLGAAQVALQHPRAVVPGDLVVARVPSRPAGRATSPAATAAPSPQLCRSEPARTTATTSTSRCSCRAVPGAGGEPVVGDPQQRARATRRWAPARSAGRDSLTSCGRSAARPSANAPNSSAVEQGPPHAERPAADARRRGSARPSHMRVSPTRTDERDRRPRAPSAGRARASSGQASTSATVTSVAMPDECPLGIAQRVQPRAALRRSRAAPARSRS